MAVLGLIVTAIVLVTQCFKVIVIDIALIVIVAVLGLIVTAIVLVTQCKLLSLI